MEIQQISKIEVDFLLEEMDNLGWTSNAIEYVQRALNNHEELVIRLKEVLSELRWTCKNGQFPGMDGTIADAEKAIAKAEGL